MDGPGEHPAQLADAIGPPLHTRRSVGGDLPGTSSSIAARIDPVGGDQRTVPVASRSGPPGPPAPTPGQLTSRLDLSEGRLAWSVATAATPRSGCARCGRSWWAVDPCGARCGCSGTATSRGRRRAWPRSASTRTRLRDRGAGARALDPPRRRLSRPPRRAALRAGDRARRRWPGARCSSASTAASTTAPAAAGADRIGPDRARRSRRSSAAPCSQPGERATLHAVVVVDGTATTATLLEAWAARVGAAEPRPHERAVPGGLVLLVPLLPRRHRGRPARQPRPRRRLALRRVPARRRLPGRHRRLAAHQRHVPLRPRRDSPPPSPPRAARRASGSPRSSPRPDSRVRHRAPRLARRVHATTRPPLVGMVQPGLGRRRCHVLDTTNPEVLAHLEAVARGAGRRRASATSSSTSPSRRR